MGRSWGGLTSKIYALVDGNGMPVLLALSPGEAHDNRLAGKMLSRLKSGSMLVADHGYDADIPSLRPCRFDLQRASILAMSPPNLCTGSKEPARRGGMTAGAEPARYRQAQPSRRPAPRPAPRI